MRVQKRMDSRSWPIPASSATHLDLAGGALGLARMLARVDGQVDWVWLARVTGGLPRGAGAIRRIGALLEILDMEIPAPLVKVAAGSHGRPIPLDSLSGGASDGPVLARWGVRLNVAPEAIREEVRR